jgi:hypothetical protein
MPIRDDKCHRFRLSISVLGRWRNALTSRMMFGVGGSQFGDGQAQIFLGTSLF